MFGFLLVGVSAVFDELSSTIGKKEVRDKVASYYTFGFLNLLFGAVFILATGIVRDDFIFNVASLPTFLVRVFLEVVQADVSVRAIMKADRSDFSVIRMITVPLLLAVDIMLGYQVTTLQIMGITLIIASIVLLSYSEHFKTKGLGLIVVSAVNAVFTISLYKYDVSHFNSVEAEQGIICLVLLLYFYICALYEKREDPIRFLLNPAFFLQTCASGLSAVTAAFAILFAPASIITAALRASSVLFAMISGRFYFKERKFAFKVAIFFVIAAGLLCLIPR